MLPVDALFVLVGDGALNPPAEGGLSPPAEGGFSPPIDGGRSPVAAAAGVARVVAIPGVCLAQPAAAGDGRPQPAPGDVGLAHPAAGVSLVCPPPGEGLRAHATGGLATPNAPLGGVGGIGRPVLVVGTLKGACCLGISPPPPIADRPIQVGFLQESVPGRGIAI